MRPVIGITTGIRTVTIAALPTPAFALTTTYPTMVRRAGGIPVMLPATDDLDAIAVLLERLDGVLMSGGGDIDPDRYGGGRPDTLYGINQDRDTFELALAREVASRRVPTLCICRGMQALNVALGGTLMEDTTLESADHLNHMVWGEGIYQPQHSVIIEPGTTTAKALGQELIEVNTGHHQAIRDVAPGLVITGRAPDGIIEAVAAIDEDWPMWAVQWHPEYLGADDAPSMNLFETFVNSAR